VPPESVINHTLVVGGSLICPPPLPGVVVGGLDVCGAGVGEETVLDGGFDLVDRVVASLTPLALADVTAGVAWGVTGGGWTVVVALVWAPVPAAARAAIDGSNSGMRSPAREALGAGPIAAPAATPRASIPAASAAVARGEGRRGTPGAVGVGVSGVGGNCSP